MILESMLGGLLNVIKEFWWIVPIAIIVLVLRTPMFKGWVGEKIVVFFVKKIVQEEGGVLLNDLMLSIRNGTTQIDHVLLLPSGIFVIETKNMKGWIFGDEKSRNWTQQIL